MKCKFEHDGHCCNCGATQYMIDCKQPCETIVTMTNADRIRAMNDEELAKWLLDMMLHKVACFGEGAFPYSPCRNEEHDCVKCGIEWLKQPAE